MIRENITICGSGLMGSGIAALFALNGYKTTIYAIEETEIEVKKKIESTLNYLAVNGFLNQSEVTASLARINVTEDLEKATAYVDLIIECVPENMELKQNLFKSLDSLCSPEVILATNTSVMSVTEIAQLAKRKERIVGTHFWNPPYLIPLVEVVKTVHTSEKVMERTMELLKTIRKHPIRVNKDVPGFVANRMQHALWREAISIVENGIADAKTVDEAVKYSFGMRLPVLGPIENADMVGTDLTLAIHDYILKYLESSKKPSRLLTEMVENNEIGFKNNQGFQEWDTNKKEHTQKRMLDHLVKMIKEL